MCFFRRKAKCKVNERVRVVLSSGIQETKAEKRARLKALKRLADARDRESMKRMFRQRDK